MATLANSPKIICRVKALYAFSSSEKSSLSFEKDEFIDVLTQLDSGWWDGWCKGNRGWFPSNYVEVVEVNPDLLQDMQQDYIDMSKPSKKKLPNPVPRHYDSDDDSEEEARTINLIKNMNQSMGMTRTPSLNSHSSHPLEPIHPKAKQPSVNHFQHPYPSRQTLYLHQNHHHGRDDEQELPLPDGWTLQIADDGITKFYVNQKTGGLRWNHPGLIDSDDELYGNSGDESEVAETFQPRYSETQKLDNFDDSSDFGSKKLKDNRMSASSIIEEPENLMEYWSKRTTPQGKVYYGNSITNETTWNYDDIDPATGRLKKQGADKEDGNNSDNEQKVDKSKSNQNDNHNHNPNDELLSWKKIATSIALSVQDLNSVVSRGENSNVVKQKIGAVVDAVRHMLYSSRSMDKESPHLQDPDVKESLRVVLSTLAKLILSAKVLSDANPDSKTKIQRDASDVLNSVRRFVLICQNKSIVVEHIKPQFVVFDPEPEPVEEPSGKRKSSTATTTSVSTMQKAKIPLNQDLIVSLQTHMMQIISSNEALCQASAHLCTLEQGYNQDETPVSEEQVIASTRKPRSNVILLFQNLSSQIGNYLAILGDIDIGTTESFQLQSLPEFRCNKQKLYNSVGLLFSAVQVLTDTLHDLKTSVYSVIDNAERLKDSINDVFLTVAKMVDERKLWLMTNGQGLNDGGGPWSPTSHTYFKSDNKKLGQSSGVSSDDASDMTLVEEIGSPLVNRFYSRQNSTPGQQHRPSISTVNTTFTNLSRPTDSKPLQRQFSYSHGASNQDDSAHLWYLGYDYAESDIEFTQDKSIKGGTLPALVERLTLHDYIDMSYIANFLLTYRSFCTTDEFIDLLQQRYNLAPPEGLTPDELEIWTEKKQKLVRLRVYSVMKNWLENYYNDEDEFILNKLQFFANTVMLDSSRFSADQLNRLIKKRRELEDNSEGLKKMIPKEISGPMPILPRNPQNITLLDIDPLELMRQLTIVDFKLYSSIRPVECLSKAWSKDGTETAVNVKQSIDYCNRLTAWVTETILSNKEAKKRVVFIKFWSLVANNCLEHSNFNTCMAIISAFDNSAIGRLKKTWELVSKSTIQTLAHIRKIMGSNKNFQEYRELIHSVNPPCIPFLGIYLQDLTFIEDGNTDFLRSTNLINFAKKQKSAEVIRDIKQFQSPPYNFRFVPELQDFVKAQLETSRDIDLLYERSLQLEPRAPTNNDNSG